MIRQPLLEAPAPLQRRRPLIRIGPRIQRNEVDAHVETLSEPRSFPGWPTKKAVLMASEYPQVRERILSRFPIMRSSAFERRMLFERSSPRQAASRPVLLATPRNSDATAPAIGSAR